jgi:hypothetical protein
MNDGRIGSTYFLANGARIDIRLGLLTGIVFLFEISRMLPARMTT